MSTLTMTIDLAPDTVAMTIDFPSFSSLAGHSIGLLLALTHA